jgi:CheY-like chemotaxis protein
MSDASSPRALRVLIVDDNTDASDLLCTQVELAGHHASSASSWPEGLERARESRPDLAFVDIGMPGMSGYELAAAFRATPELAGVILVALTGWGGDEARARAAAAGFDHHLVKPADPDAIDRILAAPDSVRRPR